MERSAALTWSWLDCLTMKRAEALKKVYGDLDQALTRIGEEMLRSLGCREETAFSVLNRLEEFDPDRYESELRQRGIRLLSIEEDDYPEKLREIADPPVFLYVRGDLSILRHPCIAIVGTREMTTYGMRVVESLVPPLLRAGCVTVSGLALGIDAVVAKETLAAKGTTVAVMGHGLGQIHPKANARIAEEIVVGGGLLVAEYPLDRPPDTYTFPGRNRIIAGLSLGTVVIEAGEKSGALITADLALDYGREVFAVPGPIFEPMSAGCLALLAKGSAKLVRGADDILTEIGVVAPDAEGRKNLFTAKNPEEERLLQALTSMPQTGDDLAEKSGLAPAVLSSTLTVLELEGAVRNLGNGTWVRR